MDKKVDAYIAGFDEPVRTQLNKMRRIIRRAVPEANEVFSNAMPGYVLHDSLVWFAGIDQNVAFYPRGYHFKQVYAVELASYKTPKGAILFPSNTALPTQLITKIVKIGQMRIGLLPNHCLPVFRRNSQPVKRALAIAKITSLKTLASHSKEEILDLHGIGPRDLPLLRKALQKVGLVFRRYRSPLRPSKKRENNIPKMKYGGSNGKYKPCTYDQLAMIPISLQQQLEPGTLEYTLHELVEHHLFAGLK